MMKNYMKHLFGQKKIEKEGLSDVELDYLQKIRIQ
jgi:hypothetical protein